jgi:FKBP-type peptidyl-prolyl cis-trans isomerase 2
VRKKNFFVPAAQAHGEILRENLFIVKREQIKANFSYQVGQVLLFQQQNGQKLGAEVLKNYADFGNT